MTETEDIEQMNKYRVKQKLIGQETLIFEVNHEDIIAYGNNEYKDITTILVIPSFVTRIGESTFRLFNKVEKVQFAEGSKLNRIDDGAFEHCIALEEINIPDSVEIIERDAFNKCRSLKEIKLSDKIKYIGNSAFEGCKSLRKVTIDKNSKLSAINNATFFECNTLEEVILPDSIERIEHMAFGYCENLRRVNWPRHLGHLSPEAFRGCDRIKLREWEGWIK